MKVKNIKIGIREPFKGLEEAKNVMQKLAKGKKVESRPFELYFENLGVMRKTITEGKLKILKVIKEKKPESIYRLAKLLNRDVKNVSNDVHFLSEMGLLELKTTSKNRGQIIPRVNYDKIIFEIPLANMK